ncbi:sigma factor-like helix-turn-helix DNA-binding protein [Conexibacter sp. CPCC 205706]|nr:MULTISPECIES: sigma factor-like helix-turn-helix DNA-binding protein [unclassified Conexibacter]MDO8185386.1 sigma factor-like helix-turn-helix DNA-binding protein [Conexibacter sp. CPCC 205706]
MGSSFDERDDERLLRATAAGDPRAFSSFYRRHLAAVLGFLLRRTGDERTTAELAAETFAVALLSCQRGLTGGETPRSWLLLIAERELRESRRRGRVRSAGRRQLEMDRIVLDVDDVRRVRALALLDPGAAILHVVDELAGEQREAVLARVVEERDWDDIARELRVPEATVRRHVRVGLAHLRTRLSAEPA